MNLGVNWARCYFLHIPRPTWAQTYLKTIEVGLDEPVEEPVGSEDEFSDDVEDASDIPVDVVSALVASGSTHVEEGFKIDDEGRVVRVAEVENAEAGEEAAAEPEPVGRGHRKKKATVPWGGVAIWERHA